MKQVRPLDGKTRSTDAQDERVERHWDIASILNSPTASITFADYVQLENMMTTLYQAGKMAATGHASSLVAGEEGQHLSHQCVTVPIE